MLRISTAPAILTRCLHGISIVVAALAVLMGWAPPAHAATRTGGGHAPKSDVHEETMDNTDVDVSGLTAVPPEPVPEETPGEELVDAALPYVGARYAWGGTTPAGFDCSGFVYFVLSQTGHPAPRDHGGQMTLGPRVSQSELEPGDLVFFQNTYMYGISHGGIYIGDGKFVHANDPSTGVIVSRLDNSYWASHWAGATRVAA